MFEAQTVRETLAKALKYLRGPFDVLFYRKPAESAARIEHIAIGMTPAEREKTTAMQVDAARVAALSRISHQGVVNAA